MRNRFVSRLSATILIAWSVILVFLASTAAQTTKPATSQPAQKVQLSNAAVSKDEYPRPPKPSKQYTIGVLLPQLVDPHFVFEAYGCVDEAQKLGVKVVMLEAGGYQHLDRQVSQVEDLIAMKVDAIFMSAVSGPGTVGAVERAVAAGIPVITGNSTSDTDKVSTWVRSDDVVIGQMQADAMAQFLKGKGNVVMLRGPAGTSWAENRGNAFKKRLAEEYPGLKVIGEQYLLSSPVDGMRVMEDFLQTYPKIDGVYNGSDAMADGAAQAVVASGNSGKIVITTTDFQPDTERFLRQGTISAAVIQQAVLIGRIGIRATVNILEKRPVPKTILVPLILATKENVANIDLSGVRAPLGWKPPNR